MTHPFQVEVESASGRVVLRLRGELDLVSSYALEARLQVVDETADVVIDLSELEFVDSTGLGVLVKTHQRLRREGRGLTLVAGSGQVSRLLTLTGLTDQLQIVSDMSQLAGGVTGGGGVASAPADVSETSGLDTPGAP